MEKDVFGLVASVGETKNSESPIRNRTADLWILRSDAPPQRHRDFIVCEAHYEIRV